jgi:hypothetical protein
MEKIWIRDKHPESATLIKDRSYFTQRGGAGGEGLLEVDDQRLIPLGIDDCPVHAGRHAQTL